MAQSGKSNKQVQINISKTTYIYSFQYSPQFLGKNA